MLQHLDEHGEDSGMRFCARCLNPTNKETIKAALRWEDKTGKQVYIDGGITQSRVCRFEVMA